MRKIKLYIATSIDGYIASQNGGLDWLTGFPNPQQIDYGYDAFYATIGSVVMGKNTYNSIADMDIDWPYANNDSYIISNQKEATKEQDNITFIDSNFEDKMNQLRRQEGKDIWLVGGGQLVSSFINKDMVDNMIITIIPTLLGAGIPLFPQQKETSQWKVANTETFYNGVLVIEYERNRQ